MLCVCLQTFAISQCRPVCAPEVRRAGTTTPRPASVSLSSTVDVVGMVTTSGARVSVKLDALVSEDQPRVKWLVVECKTGAKFWSNLSQEIVYVGLLHTPIEPKLHLLFRHGVVSLLVSCQHGACALFSLQCLPEPDLPWPP